jgi:hypothetical protein
MSESKGNKNRKVKEERRDGNGRRKARGTKRERVYKGGRKEQRAERDKG